MICRAAVCRRTHLDTREMGERPKKLPARDRPLRERSRGDRGPEEGILNLLVQSLPKREVLIRQLVDRLGIHGEAVAFRARVGDVEECSIRKLVLNIEVPLLHVTQRLSGNGRSNTKAADQRVEERRVAPRRLQHTIGERIVQQPEGRDATVERVDPGRSDGIHDVLVRRVRKRNIVRQPKDAVTCSDNRRILHAVSNCEPWGERVAVVEPRS